MQPPALFPTPTTESEHCAVYVAAAPNGRSAGRYAIPSTGDTHLPVTSSPNGVGIGMRVASPSEIFLNEEQLASTEPVPDTFDVSQPERSREDRDEQLWNMKYMSSTEEVSQPETSREDSFEQPRNM